MATNSTPPTVAELQAAAACYKRTGFYNDVHEIRPFLFLSGMGGITEANIRSRGITCVVNCTNRMIGNLTLQDLEYHNVDIDDHGEADIATHFDRCVDIIHHHKEKGGKTLVHCMGGISRSATIVIAYLVRHGDLTLWDAYMVVKKERPIIEPNRGFWTQLIEFEYATRKHRSVTMTRPGGYFAQPESVKRDLSRLFSQQRSCSLL